MVAEFPNWFDAYAKPNFEQFLIPLAGQQNLAFLQLGVYTGDASVWMLDKVLITEGNHLIDVDTWEGSDEEAHKSLDFVSVYDTYCRKTDHYPQRHKVTQTTVEFLTSEMGKEYNYDFIYVDADHTTVGVLMDAELSWPLLKSGGLLAFDDYQWGQHLPVFKTPKLGIDLFLERHLGEYEILEQGLQVWLRKLQLRYEAGNSAC